jgi:prenyltransferase beta subunit
MKTFLEKFVVLFGAVFALFGASFIFAEEVVDITPPIGTIIINDGVLYTNNRNVVLTLSATDDLSTVIEMRIANYNSYYDPEPYVTSKNWELTDNDGLKTVRVKFKDQAGNENIHGITTTITLDTAVPVITLTGETTINLNVGDSYTDAGATALDDISGDITSSIVKGGTYIDTSTAETYTITYDVKDGAGNSAIQVVRNIIVNNIPVPEESGGGNNTNTIPNLSVNESINLSDNCLITDTVGEAHLFPQTDSPSKFLGICALSQIKMSGAINNFDIINYPFGLFVDSINNIKDPSSAYWALYLNDIYEMRGLTTLPLAVGDKVSLVYVDFSNVELGPRINIKIDALVSPQDEQKEEKKISSGSSGIIKNNRVDFSIENALSFLSSQQKDNGSFGDFLYTDWAGFAFASVSGESIYKEKITNYLKTNIFDSNIATDNERHAMALMSLGINPYSGTEINYIKKIVDSFDGTQFGDPNLVNDDIFAIFPLIKAGYDSSDEMIQKDVSFIISKQNVDGSWESVDMTASAMQALSLLPVSENITKAKIQAEQYLKNIQKSDGGFENSFSTSWVIEAINSLHEDMSAWTKNNLNPINYLASLQQSDGGVELLTANKNTRIWATSYAITAVGGKSWADIMQSFTKPAVDIIGDNLNKKDIKISKIKNVEKQTVLEPIEIQNPEITTTNNLGASAGDIDISLKSVVHKASLPFIYIGKSFLNIVNFMFGF